jgi:hypothetical protein
VHVHRLKHDPARPASLQSAFNAIRFEGSAAKTAKVHVLASRPNSLTAFKAANGLQNAPWQNRLRLQVPARTWRAGETAQYFL